MRIIVRGSALYNCTLPEKQLLIVEGTIIGALGMCGWAFARDGRKKLGGFHELNRVYLNLRLAHYVSFLLTTFRCLT